MGPWILNQLDVFVPFQDRPLAHRVDRQGIRSVISLRLFAIREIRMPHSVA